MNQSRKKKKINSGEVVKIKNVDTNDNEPNYIERNTSVIELIESEPNVEHNVDVHCVNFQGSSIETEQNLCKANVNDSIQSEAELSPRIMLLKCIHECKDKLIETVIEKFRSGRFTYALYGIHEYDMHRSIISHDTLLCYCPWK